MARVTPFRGVRYAYRDKESLGKVIAPPYDVIDAKDQKAFHDLHPHNVIRLELGASLPGDDEHTNWYQRARSTYEQWLESGILLQDTDPSLYLACQRFTVDGKVGERWGFLASVGLSTYSEREIYPHEDTLQKPLEDRLRLLRALKTNVSPIFALYHDEEHSVMRLLRDAANRHPDMQAVDHAGDEHSLWVIQGQKANEVTEAMRCLPLFIADGHHRYETALRYYMERGDQAAGRVLMELVNLFDPGLVVLPTHRLIRGIPKEALEALKEGRLEGFDSTAFDCLTGLMEALNAASSPGFGCYVSGRLFLMVLSSEGRAVMERSCPSCSQAWRSLDVSALQSMVLTGGLGEAELGFTRDATAAVSEVMEGRWQVAFFVRPCKVETIKTMALSGERMPQKSTYFYPKLPTGLVLHPFY